MSWLRDRFYEFVFPAFLAAGKRTTEIGSPFDPKPAASAPDHLPSELRKLWTLCADHGVPWSYDIRETNEMGGTSKFREGAKIHGSLLRATLDSAVVAMRAERCSKLFLGGRDVWTFAVLCEKRRIPYLLVPELSRSVSETPDVKEFLEARGFTGDELFLDTGFMGSIPRNLSRIFGRPFKFRLMSQADVFATSGDDDLSTYLPPKSGMRRRPNQLFPNRKAARAEALETEYIAKFWDVGRPVSNPIGFIPEVFEQWKDRSPVYRFQETRFHGLTRRDNLGVTDGKDRVVMGGPDVRAGYPAVLAWYETLPEAPPELLNWPKIEQQFHSKTMIQRAALLTSQLWRGIPYWKVPEQERIQLQKQAKQAKQAKNQDGYMSDGLDDLLFSSSDPSPIQVTAFSASVTPTTQSFVLSKP